MDAMSTDREIRLQAQHARRWQAIACAFMGGWALIATITFVSAYILHEFDSNDLGREFSVVVFCLVIGPALSGAGALGFAVSISLWPLMPTRLARRFNLISTMIGALSMAMSGVLCWLLSEVASRPSAGPTGLLALVVLVSAIVSWTCMQLALRLGWVWALSPGTCSECGYDLRALNSDRCPECGAMRSPG